MDYKKLIVSEDNKLVLEDYNLTSNDAEILDLNKSLLDVATDKELQTFIKENAVDDSKIYFICVKEDFGTNEQIIENITNVKKLYKSIKKAFKKNPNLYFFVYNTFMKSEEAINPTLVMENNKDVQQDVNKEVENLSSDEIPNEESIETLETASNEAFSLDEEETNHEVNLDSEEGYELVDSELADQEVNEDNHFNAYPYKLDEETDDVFAASQNVDVNDFNDAIEGWDETQVEEYSQEAPVDFDSIPFVEEENQEEVAQYSDNFALDEEAQYAINDVELEGQEFAYNEDQDIDWGNIDVAGNEYNPHESINEDQVADIPAPISQTADDSNEWSNFEDSNMIFGNEKLSSEQTESPEEISGFETVDSVGEVTEYELRDVESGIEIPETYFDSEDENKLSYEDYNEFQQDYELNVHTLKSIYDFIWRMLVLNNTNLKLNDLLYLSVNNLDAFSIGQSDFVRQTANKAESLFDLILQLDIKLEFNNSLFYIYLAQFFSIKANKIVVNEKFLDTLSIWVDKVSRNKFVQQVEQFINYSAIYNKKIIFAYFIELSNFIKGCIPSINPTLSLIDIHRVLNNKNRMIREENVFGFMIAKINQIFANNEITIESELVDTPDNMFVEDKDKYSDDVDQNWKNQLCDLYKRLVMNVRNYVLSTGNNEKEIFNLYVDIKDLRMYQSSLLDASVISPVAPKSVEFDKSYLTIGDTFARDTNLAPNSNFTFDNFAPVTTTPISTPSQINEFAPENPQLSNPVIAPAVNRYIDTNNLQPEVPRFNVAELEDSMAKRIEEYERKIKQNIERIEAERKQLREKMEALRNL